MSQQPVVTKQSLIEMLNNPNPQYVQAVVGRALVVLLNRQTREEAAANQTHVHNTVGFAACDARSGSLTAKYWLKHKRLEQWMVDQWLRPNRSNEPKLVKYHRQLNEEAQRRAQ